MDRTRMELFFYELFESEKCKNADELKFITDFLADCINTAIINYCNDDNLDTDGVPVVSVDEY